MALLPELKKHYVNITKTKYNLDPVFAETLLDLIEEEKGLTNYEEVLNDCERYTQLYNHYFSPCRSTKKEGVEINAKL